MRRTLVAMATVAAAVVASMAVATPAHAAGLAVETQGAQATSCTGCASESGGTTSVAVYDVAADGHRAVAVYSISGYGSWECHNTNGNGSLVYCDMPRKSTGCQTESMRVEVREGSTVIRKSATETIVTCW
ncbi:hypothetical protein [Stackebrandtia soli]|uniref:hypothetical protein n=1 Tax=Stackebrandtia soli TaxID=1892856 RepID=UPI0039ED7568